MQLGLVARNNYNMGTFLGEQASNCKAKTT